jgi:hypothetical protein
VRESIIIIPSTKCFKWNTILRANQTSRLEILNYSPPLLEATVSTGYEPEFILDVIKSLQTSFPFMSTQVNVWSNESKNLYTLNKQHLSRIKFNIVHVTLWYSIHIVHLPTTAVKVITLKHASFEKKDYSSNGSVIYITASWKCCIRKSSRFKFYLTFHFTDSDNGPFELFQTCFSLPIATHVSRAWITLFPQVALKWLILFIRLCNLKWLSSLENLPTRQWKHPSTELHFSLCIVGPQSFFLQL